jgi:hypothetical protein
MSLNILEPCVHAPCPREAARGRRYLMVRRQALAVSPTVARAQKTRAVRECAFVAKVSASAAFSTISRARRSAFLY